MKIYNTFFTADTHFNHSNIIKYCNRPFDTIEHMNETLIDNWNSVVRQYDKIYIVGDFALGCYSDSIKILRRLNGIKYFILGSHDKIVIELTYRGYVESLGAQKTVNVEGKFSHTITLNHYSMRTWPMSHYNSWHLYGHSHGYLEYWGKSFDVGVDAWNFYPISIEQVEEVMEKRPDNFNLVTKGV